MNEDVPVRELDIAKIAEFCTDKIRFLEPKDRLPAQELINELFNTEREKVHKSIRVLGVMLSDTI